MSLFPTQTTGICRACLQASHRRLRTSFFILPYSTNREADLKAEVDYVPSGSSRSPRKDAELEEQPGAMSRRLQEATAEALLTGGKTGQRVLEDAGFSEELKEKLWDKISTAKFRKQYAGAFATAEIHPAAGEGTRGMAASAPWTGQESQGDTVLRMLDDARKPLAPGLRGKFEVPRPVDMRLRREPAVTPGMRVARARDGVASYSRQNAAGLTEQEKEEVKTGLRERFSPHAMPNSISGLEALANERIENAISRGQFKNIPRGPGIQRDTRADNPFIDTTEYIMNKMIQRQDMRPPWVEKQLEVRRAIDSFRARLRSDWRRHAARMIAAEGGSLQEQMGRAEAYALSEKLHNPRSRRTTAVGESAPEPAVSTPLPQPYRDLAWEKAEHAYMVLSIDSINSMTRSYNLMAPDLAKKPYFSLQRELAACYAEVAPLLANEIKERATRPILTTLGRGFVPAHKAGVMEYLSFGKSTVVNEVPAKAYGFKELWKDMFKKA